MENTSRINYDIEGDLIRILISVRTECRGSKVEGLLIVNSCSNNEDASMEVKVYTAFEHYLVRFGA